MDLKKIYSNIKISSILGLIFLLVILLIFSHLSFNLFSSSESDYEKSSQASQSNNDLFVEKESNESKKIDSITANKEIDAQNLNEKKKIVLLILKKLRKIKLIAKKNRYLQI